MPKVLSEPTLVTLDGVYLDTAERRMREALHDVPSEHRRQATQLLYLTYEAIARGKFGNGRFDVAITCNEEEFVVSVKGV